MFTNMDGELRAHAEALAVDVTNMSLPERIVMAERHLKAYADRKATEARKDEHRIISERIPEDRISGTEIVEILHERLTEIIAELEGK